jgi:hypothetical protein
MNPIELLWAQRVRKLRYKDTSGLRSHAHAPVTYASEILRGFTHANVGKCYKKRNYLPTYTVFD